MSRSFEPNPLAVTSSEPMKLRSRSGEESTLRMKKSQPEVVSGLRSAPKQASVSAARLVAVDPTVPVQATRPFPSDPSVSVAWLGVAAGAGAAQSAVAAATATRAVPRANPPPGSLLTAGKLTTPNAGFASRSAARQSGYIPLEARIRDRSDLHPIDLNALGRGEPRHSAQHRQAV